MGMTEQDILAQVERPGRDEPAAWRDRRLVAPTHRRPPIGRPGQSAPHRIPTASRS